MGQKNTTSRGERGALARRSPRRGAVFRHLTPPY